VRPAPEGREVTFASGKKSCPEKKSPFWQIPSGKMTMVFGRELSYHVGR
jgi:hypothetical protein